MNSPHRWVLLGLVVAGWGAAGIDFATGCGSSDSSLNGAGSGSSSGTAGGSTGASSGGSGGSSSGGLPDGGAASSGGNSNGGSGGNGSGSSGASSGGSGSGGSSGGSGSSSGAGASSGGSGSSSGAGGSGTCLQTKGNPPDYSQAGPYTVQTMTVDLADAGLGSAAAPTTFTIYYPSPMEANCPHPVVAWGNGTGVTGQTTYQFYNNNAASWGMVAIASDNSNVAGAPYLSTAVDYLLAQNKNPGSVFYQKLAAKAGVAGHSQGGIAATQASNDTNVAAEVCVEGGGTPRAGVATLCLTGSITDGGLNGVNLGVVTQTYPTTTGPAFLADWDGGDHVTTPTVAGLFSQNPQGTLQFVRLLTAWYRCYLAGDTLACGLFKGGPPGCGMCKDPGWYLLEGKNL
jgi:hypothetical protein